MPNQTTLAKLYLKRFFAFFTDLMGTMLAWGAANYLCLSIAFKLNSSELFILLPIQCICYIWFGLYRGIWRFASIPDLMRIIKSIVFGTLLSLSLFALLNKAISPRVFIIYVLLLAVCVGAPRILYRWVRDYRKLFIQGNRLLIVGAGSAGEGLIRDLYRSEGVFQYLPLAFVDDDAAKMGCEVHGVRVLGTVADIPRLVKEYKIELIIIAIPSADAKRMRNIVTLCEKSNVPFRTLPSIKNIADGIVKIDSIRNVLIEDLLGREEVSSKLISNKAGIHHKIILVTGGGGSIGSELCKQICLLQPKLLIVVDNNEYNLYAIELALRKNFSNVSVKYYLYSVTNQNQMHELFSEYHPEIVFHVAAYKHVPLLEFHPTVAIYNNIIGTKNMLDFSAKHQVGTFVLISTDKAVNPTSIMGATKRASEVLCQTYNATSQSGTRFITVRFGNVLESTGSVIPLFRKQLENGGPITVTHPDITRYFMTISEAARLILQSASISNEGEIFVLDMGEPIKIKYLAEQIIKLQGKRIGQDIEIQYTGLRPGEKLYEELFYDYEVIGITSHPKIRKAKVKAHDGLKVYHLIQKIEEAYREYPPGMSNQLLWLLNQLVPEYVGVNEESKEISGKK